MALSKPALYKILKWLVVSACALIAFQTAMHSGEERTLLVKNFAAIVSAVAVIDGLRQAFAKHILGNQCLALCCLLVAYGLTMLFTEGSIAGASGFGLMGVAWGASLSERESHTAEDEA